jgi:uncharacterized membrane-anchored protein
MTYAKTQTLMLATLLVLAVAGAPERLRGRLRGADRERGSQSLEWAIIAAIAVGLVAVVAIKITAAVTSHAAQIK